MLRNRNPVTGRFETLAARQAREVAEDRAFEAARMALAMKAVDEVSKQHNRTAMTYGVVRKTKES